MSTLLDAGLDLKKIQVQEFSQVIADINHNFTKILNLPGFRGVPGEDGESIAGPVGQRGNIWVFGNSERFISAYSELSTATQITAQFLSNALNDDDVKLYDVLQVDDLIDNDVVVLPSGPVVQLQTDLFINDVLQPPTFIDTGITFANQAGVTEDRVRDIVNNLLSGISTNNEGINRLYTAYAKNVSDLQSALNTQSSTDSAIDIDSSQAARGASLPQYRFIAGREDSIDAQTKLCLIAGHPNDYYTLLQNTLRQHNADYAPGVDNFPALIVQQNDYKSGISLGFGKTDGVPGQTGPSFRDFANIYKTETSLDIESRRSITNFASDASRLRLTNAMIEARSSAMNVITTGNFSIDSDRFIFGQNDVMFWKNGRIYLGRGSATPFVQINTDNLNLTRQTNYDFVSTDNAGKVINKYTLKQTIDPSNTSVISGSAIHAAIQSLNSTISTINASLSNRITSLENADTSGYFNIRGAYTSSSVNLNTLTEQGTYSFYNAGSLTLSNSPLTVGNDQSGILMTFKNNRLSGSSTAQRYTNVISQIFLFYGTTLDTSTLFYRIGRLNSNGVGYTFTPWHSAVNTTRSITAQGGLVGGGTLAENIAISHAISSISNVTPSNDLYVRGIQFDRYGHPTSVTRGDLAQIFTKKANNGSDFADPGVFRDNLSLYSKEELYTRSQLYTRSEVYTKTQVDSIISALTVDSGWLTVKPYASSPTTILNDNVKVRRKGNVVQIQGVFRSAMNVANDSIIFELPLSIPAPSTRLFIPLTCTSRFDQQRTLCINPYTRYIRLYERDGATTSNWSFNITYLV